MTSCEYILNCPTMKTLFSNPLAQRDYRVREFVENMRRVYCQGDKAEECKTNKFLSQLETAVLERI